MQLEGNRKYLCAPAMKKNARKEDVSCVYSNTLNTTPLDGAQPFFARNLNRISLTLLLYLLHLVVRYSTGDGNRIQHLDLSYFSLKDTGYLVSTPPVQWQKAVIAHCEVKTTSDHGL